ncbi:MAG: NAD(P)-dependent oxidoreductase, partial [Chthoniobacterales bacterium]
QIFVADDEALLEMIQRIKTALTPQHIVMAHCTVSPDTMRAAAEMVQRRGAQFLDAPFTGSKNAAEMGELVYYIGGDEAVLREARPVLEASSKEIIEIGGIGDATTMKVATNMITAATVQAAVEALAVLHNSGLSVEKFAIAMRSNGSNSGTLEMKLPLMLEGNFEPHFSVKHMLKDVEIATRLARNFGLEFGATDAARRCLAEEARAGHGDADYCSVMRHYFPEGIPVAMKGDALVDEEVDLMLDLTGAERGAPPKPAEMPEEVLGTPSSTAAADDGRPIESDPSSSTAQSVSLAAPKLEEPSSLAAENDATSHFSADQFAEYSAVSEASTAGREIETDLLDNQAILETSLALPLPAEEQQAAIEAGTTSIAWRLRRR